MKKFFYLFALLALFAGVAYATTIPDATEPNAGGPNLWLESVYNNSGGSLAPGDVVIWQVGSSTGADDNWVTTTTTADTYLVAGVVYPSSIAAGASGSIAIRGPVNVNVLTTGGHLGTVGGLVCNSGTAKLAKDCSGTLGPPANFGVVTSANSSNVAKVCVKCTSN